ncbi:hypothetical protein BOTBODRAFT_115678, partial [Botryobasidium botryosum FD-172 SS1]
YVQQVDIYARFCNRPSVFETRPFYGQLKLILSFAINPSTSFREIDGPTLLVLAVISPCKINRHNRLGAPSYRNTGPLEVVDLEAIEALVGRVKRPNSQDWFIIKRKGIFARIQLADDDELERKASRALQGT